MSYTQLSADEHLELYRLRQMADLSLRVIAMQQQVRRQQAKQPFVRISEVCLSRIKAQLRQYHSPEQITGSLLPKIRKTSKRFGIR